MRTPQTSRPRRVPPGKASDCKRFDQRARDHANWLLTVHDGAFIHFVGQGAERRENLQDSAQCVQVNGGQTPQPPAVAEDTGRVELDDCPFEDEHSMTLASSRRP